MVGKVLLCVLEQMTGLHDRASQIRLGYEGKVECKERKAYGYNYVHKLNKTTQIITLCK